MILLIFGNFKQLMKDFKLTDLNLLGKARRREGRKEMEIWSRIRLLIYVYNHLCAYYNITTVSS